MSEGGNGPVYIIAVVLVCVAARCELFCSFLFVLDSSCPTKRSRTCLDETPHTPKKCSPPRHT